MTEYKYILEGHKPMPCSDVLEWGLFFYTARIVAVTEKKGIKVSTVFLGIDHSYGEGPPLLFETMVFGGKHNDEMKRYSTWEEAEEGHLQMCKKVGFEAQEQNLERFKKKIEEKEKNKSFDKNDCRSMRSASERNAIRDLVIENNRMLKAICKEFGLHIESEGYISTNPTQEKEEVKS